jgi:hypothetical protein
MPLSHRHSQPPKAREQPRIPRHLCRWRHVQRQEIESASGKGAFMQMTIDRASQAISAERRLDELATQVPVESGARAGFANWCRVLRHRTALVWRAR